MKYFSYYVKQDSCHNTLAIYFIKLISKHFILIKKNKIIFFKFFSLIIKKYDIRKRKEKTQFKWLWISYPNFWICTQLFILIQII
jgi:hypothetical protein